MKRSSLQCLLLVGALLLSLSSAVVPALAGNSGGIAGRITDARTGFPIAGVDVEISSQGQVVTTKTDAKGHFAVLNLQPDDYVINAVKNGYVTQSASGYSVYADQTQQYDLQLSPVPASPPR